MKKLKEQDLVDNLGKFYDLLSKYLPDNKRTSNLINFYKSIEIVLLTSPASARITQTGCYPGGYIESTIKIIESALILDKVWDKLQQTKNYTIEELVFSAANCNLGRLGTNDKPFFKPNDNQWEIDKKGELFKFNPEMTHMRYSDRAIYTLQNAGINMTENEFLSIKLKDGAFDESNKVYLIQYSPEFELKSNLPYIIHQADLIVNKCNL